MLESKVLALRWSQRAGAPAPVALAPGCVLGPPRAGRRRSPLRLRPERFRAWLLYGPAQPSHTLHTRCVINGPSQATPTPRHGLSPQNLSDTGASHDSDSYSRHGARDCTPLASAPLYTALIEHAHVRTTQHSRHCTYCAAWGPLPTQAVPSTLPASLQYGKRSLSTLHPQGTTRPLHGESSVTGASGKPLRRPCRLAARSRCGPPRGRSR